MVNVNQVLAATVVLSATLSAWGAYRRGELLWRVDFTAAEVEKYGIKPELDWERYGHEVVPKAGREGAAALHARVKDDRHLAILNLVPDKALAGLVQVEADVKGVDVGEPLHEWNGPKVMFPYSETPGGKMNFPGLKSQLGTFDWQTWTMVHRIPQITHDFKFCLGLECCPGEVWIDSVRVYRVEEIPDEQVVAPKNERAAKIPRGRFAKTHNPKARRGVMSGGDLSEAGLLNLAMWGANLMRLQINMPLEEIQTEEGYFDRLTREIDVCAEVMDRCRKHDIRCIIDLHTGPGCKATKFASNMLPDDYDTTNLRRAWRMIVERLKNHPMTYAYDILNEPCVTPSAWDRIFRETMAEIRRIDRKTPCVTQFFQHYYKGENVIYSPHYYSPHTLTHQGVGGMGEVRWNYPGYIDGVYWDKEQIRCALEREIRFQSEHPDAKILVGEFSCILWTKGADKFIRDAIEIFEEYGWDWTYHAYRECPGWDVEYEHDGNWTMRMGAWKKATQTTDRKRELLKGLSHNPCREIDFSSLADDPDRPQLAFSAPFGWINDPNGLSFYKGEWHLFYQHNPSGNEWGPPCWGHAVSKDLVHWRNLGEAIEAKDGGSAWSGGALVDRDGVAGCGRNAQLLYYTWVTENKHTQCLAYSTDGRNYTAFKGNPLVTQDPKFEKAQDDRDPHVFWHEGAKKWVMLHYGSDRPNGEWHPYFYVHHSDDLIHWKEVGRLDGLMAECPSMTEFQVEGEKTKKWVFFSACPMWWVGEFDGTKFTVETKGEGFAGWDKQWYAFQLFANTPKDRKVGLGWAKQNPPAGSKRGFNQAMTPALEFQLVRTKDGLKLSRLPVKEYERLRKGPAKGVSTFRGELADIAVSADVASDGRLELSLRGVPLVYDAKAKKLSVGAQDCPWKLADGKLSLRILVDRLGVTAFDADGTRIVPDVNARPDPSNLALAIKSRTGVSNLDCQAYELNSIWKGK